MSGKSMNKIDIAGKSGQPTESNFPVPRFCEEREIMHDT